MVADLIEHKFGIELGLTAVGALLAKLEITPQKPLQRAYQRDPQAIEKWKKETFPGIRRQAKTKGAEVFFWDESGFRADAVHGRTWGLKGHTPVVERPGQRQSISAASAVSVRVRRNQILQCKGSVGDNTVQRLAWQTRKYRAPSVDGSPFPRVFED